MAYKHIPEVCLVESENVNGYSMFMNLGPVTKYMSKIINSTQNQIFIASPV